MSTRQHTEVLGTMGLGRLIARLAIPSSIALFVSATYNLVDTIFVGRGVGTDAIGALTLVFPFQMIVMAFGNLVGIGAASIISRSLGARNPIRARQAAGTAVTVAFGLGLLTTLLGTLFTPTLARVLGATGALSAPTLQYLRVILIGVPLQILNIAANNIIRAEGQARAAMATMVAGMVVNIGLDPVFIFALGWGVRGAAIGTVIGHGVTTAIIVIFYARGRGSVRIRPRDLRPNLSIIREMVTIGSSGFVRQTTSSFMQGLRNNLLMVYGGTVFVAAFGVVFRSLLFLAMPAMGIAQALPTIAGYNYGAGKMDRVRRSVWVSILASTAVNITGFLVMMVFPHTLLRLFSSDPALIADGVSIMRVNAVGMLVFATYFTGPSFYQAIGKPLRALILALTRPIIATVIMLVGIRAVGPMAAVAADPIAIVVGAVIVALHFRRSFSKRGELG